MITHIKMSLVIEIEFLPLVVLYKATPTESLSQIYFNPGDNTGKEAKSGMTKRK
jgi:hypothetical protein